MNTIQESIENLHKLSQVLEEYANRKENYNSSYANHLEILSWEMFKHANELKELQYYLGC